jgi:RNA polymerase sigma factor (sigma-70 family)
MKVVNVDKETLKQYRALKKEKVLIEKKLDKLYKRKENIPVVMGKVVGSSHDFPYTKVRTSVEMEEPKENDTINQMIKINEQREAQANKLILSIETFINSIPDSLTRQVFELVYINGMKLDKVGDMFGYSKSRISQIISDYLKD